MQILLAIDVVFFFIELSVGITVHSLALVADSFHMLNDVLSLCVGLWAVHVAKSKPRSKTFTYGWQGAETLGALINGVFLAALCLSIILEAVERFFQKPEIGDPKWILGVGSAGLVTNLLGLVLFHDHGHGGHSHGHGAEHGTVGDGVRNAEEGRINRDVIADEEGRIEDVLPENRVRFGVQTSTQNEAVKTKFSERAKHALEEHSLSSSLPQFSPSKTTDRGRRRSKSRAFSTIENLQTHPAYMRSDIIAASQNSLIYEEDSDSDAFNGSPSQHKATENTPLLNSSSPTPITSPQASDLHASHKHAQRRASSHGGGHGHGHSHGDLNMQGVWLHVMGDALGNIGVIGAALFIWLSPYSWRAYADPAVSLVIAFIILYSAYPLCRAASRILLMAVPLGVNIDDIKADVIALPGVAGCHHVHVWQLSDTTLVASLHVRVDEEIINGTESGDEYMRLARAIRKCLHAYGIHSTTIQPEFCTARIRRKLNGTEPSTEDESCREEDTERSSTSSINPCFDGTNETSTCLLDCEDDCAPASKCCGPPARREEA